MKNFKVHDISQLFKPYYLRIYTVNSFSKNF